MNSTLVEGDYIVVNKLVYGARIPITPLSLPFGHTYVDWIEIPYTRIFGFSDIKRNDIIVFNFPLETELPIDHRQEYVKRCIALAGDTIQLKKGIVSVNGKRLKDVLTLLVPRDANGKRTFIDSSFFNPAIFPNSSSFRWNADHFGPLIVPKKGNRIALTSNNLTFYKRIIEVYENNTLEVKGGKVYVNSIFQKSYVFKMDYYFVMGDNRSNSVDSRFWGFVPEDHLIGKVVYDF